MNEQKFFLTQIKRNVSGVYEKGVVVKDTLASAKQSAHAYLGAYGYGNDSNINYVACFIYDMEGNSYMKETDNRIPLESGE